MLQAELAQETCVSERHYQILQLLRSSLKVKNMMPYRYADISHEAKQAYEIDIQLETFQAMVAAGLRKNDIMYFAVQEYYGSLLRSESSAVRRKEIYKRAYSVFTKLQFERGSHDQGVSEQVIQFALPFVQGKDILEIGAGSGRFAEWAIDHSKSYSFVEPSSESCEMLLKRLNGKGSLKYFHRGLIQELVGDEVDVDTVYCNDVYEHLHQDDAAEMVRIAYKLIRKGGNLVIVTSNKLFGPFDGTGRYRGKGSSATGLHINETSYLEITNSLLAAGFKSVKSPLMPVSVFNSLPFPVELKRGWPLLSNTKWKSLIERKWKYLSKYTSVQGVLVVARK